MSDETAREREYRLKRAHDVAGETLRAAKNAIDYLNATDDPDLMALAYETMRAARATHEALAKALTK